MIHNLCAILDLRLQRWLNVVEPLLLAFCTLTRINCDAQRRLCAFYVTPGKQIEKLNERRELRQYSIEQAGGLFAFVTCRELIVCVRFESKFINASRLDYANMHFTLVKELRRSFVYLANRFSNEYRLGGSQRTQIQ